MEWGTMSMLLLSGFFSLSSHQRAFNFVPQPMNWWTARAHCSQHYVELATVNDAVDLGVLSGLADPSNDVAFVGLQKIWTWEQLESDDYRDGLLTFRKFGTGQPNPLVNCGTITPTGEWFSQTCATELPFFCYKASVSDITQRFVKGNSTMSWDKAKSYCNNLHTGLARIRNPEENQRLLDIYSAGPAWIGLTQTVWTWSDGSSASFIPWTSGYPMMKGSLCSVLKIAGNPPGIMDWDCTDTLPFFCYSLQQKKYSVKVKISAGGTLNLADAALSDSLLKWVQTKLKDRGMSRDVQLSWSKPPAKIKPAPKPVQDTCPKI